MVANKYIILHESKEFGFKQTAVNIDRVTFIRDVSEGGKADRIPEDVQTLLAVGQDGSTTGVTESFSEVLDMMENKLIVSMTYGRENNE